MRRAITSLLTMGIGAAAYSLRDRRNRKRFMQTMQPIMNNVEEMIPKRRIRKMRKRLVRAIS
ncbi:DUF3918 domain-containing protein [Anaerobacillus sp. MEB173]|uniref:DUF3918 family protein n=1 Tax=Anaerobacillus sp. MEB173 TaxID=3383345 RepID=UPI003F90E190